MHALLSFQRPSGPVTRGFHASGQARPVRRRRSIGIPRRNVERFPREIPAADNSALRAGPRLAGRAQAREAALADLLELPRAELEGRVLQVGKRRFVRLGSTS